jgi:hypothetical protein
MSLAEIKSAIQQLSFEERAELAAWLHGWKDDEWDEQMKRDTAAGSSTAFCTKSKRTSKRDASVRCREVQNAPAFLERVQPTARSRPMSRARKVSTVAS